MKDHDREKISEYASKRLKVGDDRCSDDKLNSDAKLRGSIGTRHANEVIKTIDDLKMRGH